MFKALGDLFRFVSLIISAGHSLAEAGKLQADIVKESSEFDVRKKRMKLAAELEAFEKELAEKSADIEKLKAA